MPPAVKGCIFTSLHWLSIRSSHINCMYSSPIWLTSYMCMYIKFSSFSITDTSLDCFDPHHRYIFSCVMSYPCFTWNHLTVPETFFTKEWHSFSHQLSESQQQRVLVWYLAFPVLLHHQDSWFRVCGCSWSGFSTVYFVHAVSSLAC